MEGRVICLWSGPRNVSTALMYSFAQIGEIEVIDEPLYAHYLATSGREHPGREDVLAAQDNDGDRVMSALLERQRQAPEKRLFCKQMAHHLTGLELGFLGETDNIFLVRDPRDMLPSLTVQVPDATLDDTGLKRQWEIYEALVSAGQSPAVLDSRELLTDPAGVLATLCAHLGVHYSDAMLSWPAGPRAEDGVWAPHWYHAVHESTGFSEYIPKSDFPARLSDLLGQCEPWYEKLHAVAIKAGSHDSSTNDRPA